MDCVDTWSHGPSLKRAPAAPAILKYYTIFPPPIFLAKLVFMQQLYCFQYNIAVGTTPYGKRLFRRTKPGKPRQSILEGSLHWPQCLNLKHITKKIALLCLHPKNLYLYFGHSAAPNPYNYVASLVFYCSLGLASVGMRLVGIVAEVQSWTTSVAREAARWLTRRSASTCNVLLWGVFRVEECVDMIKFRSYRKYSGECTRSSEVDCRHGSGGVAFPVRRVSYR